MDHFRHSFDFVAFGNDQWLCDWRIHSYPPGDRHRRGTDSNYSGTKTAVANWTVHLLRKEINIHETDDVVGIVLVIGGVVLVYHGITYTTHEKVLQIGPLEATKKTEKTIPLPPLLGGVALAGGIVLIIMGAKK